MLFTTKRDLQRFFGPINNHRDLGKMDEPMSANRAQTLLARRTIVKVLGAVGVSTAITASRGLLGADWLEETPAQPVGPFYAPFKPLSIDSDLVHVPGSSTPAEGQVIELVGHVRDQTGQPIAGARVEIFQANRFGRYNHPRHANSNLKLDPHFQGFGHDASDEQGRYGFRTIKPGPYPDNPNWTRPPHIHFVVFPPTGAPWATQMYFEGEALNRDDLLLRGIPERARHLVVRPISPATENADGFLGRIEFDIVLGQPGIERAPA